MYAARKPEANARHVARRFDWECQLAFRCGQANFRRYGYVVRCRMEIRDKKLFADGVGRMAAFNRNRAFSSTAERDLVLARSQSRKRALRMLDVVRNSET